MPQSFPWFSTASASAIAHRNQLSYLHQQNKYCALFKVKFKQAGNCCKSVLEAAKLAYAN